MFKRFSCLIIAAMLLGSTAVSSLRAQTMVEQVPEDALLYIGWQGAGQLGDEYKQSHLNELLAEPQTQMYMAQLRETIQALIATGPEDEARAFEAMMNILPAVWQHPTAVYGVMSPAPRLVVLARPDNASRDRLVQQLTPLVAQGGESVSLSQADGLIVLQMSPQGTTPDAYQKPATSLSTTEKYKAAIDSADADTDSPMVAYVDLQTAMRIAISMAGPPREGQPDPQVVLAALGLDKVRSMVKTIHFDEKDWVVNAHVEAPGPRTGLLAMIDDAKVTRDDLKKIPGTANSFYAASVDLGRLVEQVREAAGAIQPEGGAEQVDQMLFLGSMYAGINLQEDLFKAMGPVWLMYTDPAMPNSLFGPGMGLVNKLRDPDRLKQSIEQLKITTTRQLQTLRENQSGPMFPVTFQTITYKDVEVQSAYIMMVGMHWAVVDEHLFIGSSPQGVVSMVRAASDTDDNITTRDDVKKMLSRLETDEVNYIQFVDLPSLAPQSYPLLMMLNQTMAMGASQELGQSPLLQLPALDVLLRHLSPDGYQITSSESGLDFRYITPYPGAAMLGTRVDASSAALGVGILLPALGAARGTARQMQSSTQARGIHSGVVLYYQGNPDTPPTLAKLIEDNYFTVEYVLSPNGPNTTPPDFGRWDKAQRNEWIQQNASYVIVTKDLKAMVDQADGTKIVVFERPDHSRGGGVSVAWGDNRASFEPLEKVQAILLEQTGQTMEELIEAQMNMKR